MKERKILLSHSFSIKDDKPVFNAISYHRINQPHKVMARMFPEYTFIHCPEIEKVSDEFLQQFDLIIFLRFIGLGDHHKSIIIRLKKLGIPFAVDTDDYWVLPENHVAVEFYKNNNLTELIADSLKQANFVICTTPILQDKIRELNKNVYVIENGIDTEDPSWIPEKREQTETNRIKFGFLQGSTHIFDMYLINHDVQKALKSSFFKKGGQIKLAFHYEFGKPSIFVGYERLLTDNFKLLNKDYAEQLKRGSLGTHDQPYKRMPFKEVQEFGTLYNKIDISVCPLQDNLFNSCKSELKMIEAGFMDCAVMVSDVAPYNLIANKDNSFLLSERDFFYWSKYIIQNPSCLEDKKAALKETVKKYDLKLLSEKRKQIYESIMK